MIDLDWLPLAFIGFGKSLLDGFDTGWRFISNDIGLVFYQSTSDTKVVWQRTPVNGAFALIYGYGKYEPNSITS